MSDNKHLKKALPRIKEYDADVEMLFLRILYSNPTIYSTCRSIIKPQHYYTNEIKNAVYFINNYVNDHKNLPNRDQLSAVTKLTIEDAFIENDEHAKSWFLTEYENFARYKELEFIITSRAPKLLQKNDYKTLLDLSKSAVEMGLVKDIGIDYFSDPIARLEELKKNTNISTGYSALDDKLYGGFERGTLNVICGKPGGGKSIALANFAINYAKQGFNVAIISLELSVNLYSLRMDSMITGLGTRQVMRNSEDASMRVLNFKRQYKGNMYVERLPSSATSLDILSYLQELTLQTNNNIDVLIVDYLDLCFPASSHMNVDGQFTKDKLVSEELRDLAIDKNMICITASQLNRSSFEAVDLDSNHIAGGISKVNTADNLFAITTTPQMQKQGTFGFKLVKTRTSAGVGSDVDLSYDPISMRIENAEPSEDTTPKVDVNNMLTKKSKNNSSGTVQTSVAPNIQKSSVSNLHDIMNKIKKNT